jgi:hypothetical protein
MDIMLNDITITPEKKMIQRQRMIQRRCASTMVLRQHFRGLTAKSFVPKPTWSLKDLNLTNNHTDPVSMEELQMLAKRSLLDVIEDDMRQDLANMLQCLRKVQSVRVVAMGTAVEIYDVPRGVTKAPVRTGEATTLEKLEAEQVFKSLLLPKTVKQGSHDYFAVVTKRTEV